ncbi:hypothetical protein ACFYY3_18550 [Streptomyces sp. NPDC001812]|uniref:hypothetical protein n=1 Tax=Streptomyces sp. NPDC001812 TaxID=3364611 RepID=UPI003682F4E8
MGQELIDGRFRVGPVIGRGNMKEVHRAEDLHAPEGTPERTVAVKTILCRRTGTQIDTGSDAKAVQRFAREVRMMRWPLHPNLTRLVAGGMDQEAGSLPYLEITLGIYRRIPVFIDESRKYGNPWGVSFMRMFDMANDSHMFRFNVTRDNDMKAYGTYRTKDLILAEYDRMTQASLTLENPLVDGENYTSTLTPPLGHGPQHERAGE